MGANRKIETLTDLTRYDSNVRAVCRCGRKGVIDGRKLSRYFFVRRWDTRVHMVGGHLRCSNCGARPVQIGFCHDKPTGPEWGPRDERDWKRLVARLRG